MKSRVLKTVVSLAQQFYVFDIRRDFVGAQRRLRVGLGEAVGVLAAHLDTVFPEGTEVIPIQTGG